MSTSSKRGPCLIQHYESNKEDKEECNEEIWCISLPDDVVLEILSRLPPKPFFRSKCVSKTWLALSSSAFCLNKHLQPTLLGFFYNKFQQPNSKIGFKNISGGVYEVDATLSAVLHHDRFCILDCCNGLLLIQGWMRGECYIYKHLNWIPSVDMYVYNPATRKCITIGMLPRLNFPCRVHEMFSLAFDPQDQTLFHVVCFRHSHNVEVCANIILTFSFFSGTWQPGENLQCHLNISQFGKGTFLDGKVHRVTDIHELVSVDPINNSYSVTKFEFPALTKGGSSDISQSHGILHFMFLDNFDNFLVWVLEDSEQQKWIFKHRLSFEGLHLTFFQCCHIHLHPEKDILIVDSRKEHVLSIELHTGKSNEICILPYPTCDSMWLYMPCFLV